MRIYVLKFTAFFLACFCCVQLQQLLNFSPVLAAASVGFIGSFYHFEKWVEKQGIHAIIYSGAFAGMCSPEYLSATPHIFFISVIGSGLYLYTKPHFNGFGGKMGTIAFISTLLFIASRRLW